jgi:hypothetical protein
MSLSDIGSRLGKPSGFGGYRNPWILAIGGIFFEFSERRNVLQTLNSAKLGSSNSVRRTAHIVSMTKVVRQESLIEVTIATWPSRIEVFSGLHDGYFWGVHHHDIVFRFRYTPLVSSLRFRYTPLVSSLSFRYTPLVSSLRFRFTPLVSSLRFRFTPLVSSLRFRFTPLVWSLRFRNTPLVFHRRGFAKQPYWYSAGRDRAVFFAPCKP